MQRYVCLLVVFRLLSAFRLFVVSLNSLFGVISFLLTAVYVVLFIEDNWINRLSSRL